MTHPDGWRRGDVVLSQRTGSILEYLGQGFKARPRWLPLSPDGAEVEGFDPAEPLLLARWYGTKRLPVLDLEKLGEPRCYHVAGATWQGKCVDCGSVCAPNLNEGIDPAESVLPLFGADEDGAA